MASHETGQLPADNKTRGVSPSAHSHPQYDDDPSASLSLDPSLSVNASFSNPPPYLNDPHGGASESDAYAYSAAGYLPATSGFAPADHAYSQTLPLSQPFDPSINQQGLPQTHSLPPSDDPDVASLLDSNPNGFDFSLYQNPTQNQAVNPADLLSQMPSPRSPHSPHSAASPQLSPQDPPHSSPGPMSPPSSTPGTYYTPQHSRHASLDPAAAAYLAANAHPDWQAVTGNAAFQGHRRAPSEVSEVSSAAHSPYMSQHESFDGPDNNPSPLLAPQHDPGLYDNALGIESFTLSDHPPAPQTQAFSPGHSPYLSPQLMPQPGGEMIPNIPYVSAPGGPDAHYPAPSQDLYSNGMDAFPGMPPGNMPLDIGQASSMAPPSINVEFAPPSRNPVVPQSKAAGDLDSLSPPPPSMRSRMRSKSDPYAHPASRPRSPSATSLEPLAPSSPRSLSPFDSGRHSNPGSRDPSPASRSRRVSTSSIDSRNYILGLADPQRPGANPNDSKRVQKHPATFQCHLCPKRFTRAYNLRSHLRTHTDERPFVCTVCGKAFARQHDRKRHEGLHSGEKKFVCRGELARDGQWGCGRRFARADALGRHFRSEAGRICIKPLLDEECQERERSMLQHSQHPQHLQPIPAPLTVPGMDGTGTGHFVLPAALLAQYPALQTLQWDQIPASADDPSDMGGRSSFDASSGGEYGFDDDESVLSSVSGMSGGYGHSDPLYGGNSGPIMGVPTETGYQQDWRE
ncbi:hypothetical protein BDW42DRAFT_163137 [Aspergillus taichungensis]|uniref:C2H2-type domain-containing protein n=1 Tax=Aspergillus taichungensis TaxID=482145 RepID=A0A2J5I2V0_9EURO|nr:hypothetical protein BDW42DRAFT_163137 [Aspergillus taichungensis]